MSQNKCETLWQKSVFGFQFLFWDTYGRSLFNISFKKSLKNMGYKWMIEIWRFGIRKYK